MNYIDLSYQNTYELFKNNNISNCSNYINDEDDEGDEGDEDDKLIEGYSNFGRVNLEKCCPLGYMWSEGQNKCVKICSDCSTSSYGDINYEFLHNHGDEFMSFSVCKGDATGAYDFNEINKRYDPSELLDQYDMNIHVDFDENASGVQPAEEDPWSPVSGGMYQVSAKQQQMNIRHATSDGDTHTWDNWVSYDEGGDAETVREDNYGAITDEQRYDLQSGATTVQDLEDQPHLLTSRVQFCAYGPPTTVNSDSDITTLFDTLCADGALVSDIWAQTCASPNSTDGQTAGVNGGNTLCNILKNFGGAPSNTPLKLTDLCGGDAECPA
tara:strand:- start:1731 stop:2708 length:978 start_codon:yes stop_codon:yes gene_type:complete